MQESFMPYALKVHGPHLLVWLVLSVVGGALLARLELGMLREAFETDARISPRLLSQRVVQHEAVLATRASLVNVEQEVPGPVALWSRPSRHHARAMLPCL